MVWTWIDPILSYMAEPAKKLYKPPVTPALGRLTFSSMSSFGDRFQTLSHLLC